MALAGAKRGNASSLTNKLREFSVKYVKISEETTTRAKMLVKDYIEDQIIEYCRQKSEIGILKLEYTGSFYERLKTEAADEADIMVILETSSTAIEVIESKVPGYVRLRAKNSPTFRKYSSPEGYINAKSIRGPWFKSLVSRAVNRIKTKSPYSEVRLVVRNHGPAVQVDIFKKESDERFLSVDLVPSFQVDDHWYVPKPFKGKRYVFQDELLWRKSFSPKEKQCLASMDRDDHGCRHELLRIVKTIVKRPRTSLPLDSYHLKTAFMHYIERKDPNWVNGDALGKNFPGFFEELQRHLASRNLPHYWLNKVNLLDDFKEVVVMHMKNRLRRILNSDLRLDKILE